MCCFFYTGEQNTQFNTLPPSLFPTMCTPDRISVTPQAFSGATLQCLLLPLTNGPAKLGKRFPALREHWRKSEKEHVANTFIFVFWYFRRNCSFNEYLILCLILDLTLWLGSISSFPYESREHAKHREAQRARSGRHRANLQLRVVPSAAPPVAPRRLSVGWALRLMLERYGEISGDGELWSSLCLFNSWLLFDYFFFNMQMFDKKVPCLRFLLWKHRKKCVGAASWLYF